MIAVGSSDGEPTRIPSYGMIPAFSDASHSIRLVLGSLGASECLVLVPLLLPTQLRLSTASTVSRVARLGHRADLLTVQEVVDDLMAVLNFIIWA